MSYSEMQEMMGKLPKLHLYLDKENTLQVNLFDILSEDTKTWLEDYSFWITPEDYEKVIEALHTDTLRAMTHSNEEMIKEEKEEIKKEIKMATCYWCYWGWPKPIKDIYDKALIKLDGDTTPLDFGPAHTIWSNENWDSETVQWCLDEDTYKEAWDDLTDIESAVVRESLELLLALSDDYKSEPEGYDDDDENPQKFPPPEYWKCVKLKRRKK